MKRHTIFTVILITTAVLFTACSGTAKTQSDSAQTSSVTAEPSVTSAPEKESTSPAVTETPEPESTPEAQTQTPTPDPDVCDELTDLDPDSLLIDYFYRTVGTPMEMPYYEIVLYTDEDPEHLRLEVYTEGGTLNEYVRAYSVPLDAYQDIMQIIIRENMHKWNELEDTYPIAGGYTVCKFFYNGEIIRVTTEQMPENGLSAFGSVANAMASYIDEDALLYEDYIHPAEEREPEPVIHDFDELEAYVETIPLTVDNYEEYGHISTGMGPGMDDYGRSLGGVLSYVTFTFDKGYFPYEDFSVTVSFTKRDDGKNMESTATAADHWYYDEYDPEYTVHAAEFDGGFGFDDVEPVSIEGSVMVFSLPEEYLHEDEDGSYFYYINNNTRYYLDGHREIEEGGVFSPVNHPTCWVSDFIARWYSD